VEQGPLGFVVNQGGRFLEQGHSSVKYCHQGSLKYYEVTAEAGLMGHHCAMVLNQVVVSYS
jgi:hypothetical protein